MFPVIKDFVDAALPWMAVSVGLAVVIVYGDTAKDKEKKHEK